MPDDDSQTLRTGNATEQHARTNSGFPRSLFEIPPPLKRIFDKFPLVSYAANDLPQRAQVHRAHACLYVFTTDDDAAKDGPSFNPGCLKWQAYLKFCDIPFRTAAANNHASPSGALPYLQPAAIDRGSLTAPDAVPSSKLKRWVSNQGGLLSNDEKTDELYDVYAALIDGRIRKAWLYQLYLAPQNSPIVDRLYIHPCSSQPLVRMAINSQLHSAAETELVKSCKGNVVSVLDLLSDSEEAFEALSTLLGDDEWFFGRANPGLYDASLFAYTHLILDESFQWKHNPLGERLRQHRNLIHHTQRIRDLYF